MSNNLPYKVTKKAVMTKYIPTHVQSECESKNNLCQKTTVEQFNLSRSFKDMLPYHCATSYFGIKKDCPGIEYF